MIHNGEQYYQMTAHPAYWISRIGLIYSTKVNRLLKPHDNGIGYKQVWIADKWRKIHRLVGLQFIPNPLSLSDINHKDLIKANNHVDNLEWCNRSQNIKHSYDSGREPVRNMLGKKHSADTKLLQSAAKIGSNHPRFIGYWITPAGTYTSINQAASTDNIDKRKLKLLCKSGVNGYSFEPVCR